MAELGMIFGIFLCLISISLGIDPPVFIFYLCAGILVLFIPLILYADYYQKKWLEQKRLEWKKKYPNTKSLAKYMKELEEKK